LTTITSQTDWVARAKAVLPAGGFGNFDPGIVIREGRGARVRDEDGNEYVDYLIGSGPLILGHSHPEVLEAVTEQLPRGQTFFASNALGIELAEEICRALPCAEHLRYVSTGGEADMYAMRLARAFTGRDKIVKFEGGYHGSHDPVEVSVAPPLAKAGPAHAPNPVPGAGGSSPSVADEVLVLPYNDEAAVERLIVENRNDLACVIFDPKCGILNIRPEFARAVRRITRENGILLIFDEIVAFRSSPGGLQAIFGIDPDLTCFGKIVGGGFPVGAFGGRADMMDLLDNSKPPSGFSQSGTFSSHPLAMVAGLAMLQELTPQACGHLNRLGDRLTAGLNEMFARKGIVAQCVNTGSVFSIYFSDRKLQNYRDLAAVDGSLVSPTFLALLEEGYFLGHTLGMCCLALPMTDDDIDGLIEATGRAISRTQAE
jgi:glutamate-1-semialdehyde 2,1-aminomutase